MDTNIYPADIGVTDTEDRDKEQIPMVMRPSSPASQTRVEAAVPASSGCCAAADGSPVSAGPNRRTMMKSAGMAGTAAVIGSTVALTSACSEDEPEPTQDASLPVSDVPVGSGTVIDGTYVVTQPTEGEFFAFSSVCTHQGCQVTRVTEEAIICPCHSTHFSVTTGEVLSGPAEEPLPEYEVAEDGGTLTITGK